LRIVFATPRIPYPPTDGGRIVMLNPIRHLGELGHEVHLVSFAKAPEGAAAESLRNLCASVRTVPLPRLSRMRGILAQPPATLARYASKAMHDVLYQTVHTTAADIVELDTLHMAIYGRSVGSRPRLLRPQNVEHLVWARYARVATPAFSRPFFALQSRRIRHYEARAMTRFVDATLAVSEADRAALAEIAPQARIDWLPMGVDTDYFGPADIPATPGSIVLTGSFEWAPKRHNLEVLVYEVLPLIRRQMPTARLSVVGSGLSGNSLRGIRDQPGVDYVGPVEDVRPYIARSSVAVNYVESGGGIAIKVLEAMAMAKAVVANTVAAEGIAAKSGRDLLVARSKSEFAEMVAMLLADPIRQSSLGQAGRRLVLETYSSSALARSLADYYARMVELHRSRTIRPRRF
jgi:glycosyltransferase involved in cell wall biosynthesis